MGSASHCARIVAEMGHAALAITNHGNINSALKHRKACNEQGVIPIIGVESYWRPDRLVRGKEWRYKRWHLVLLAKNLRGYHNIIRLTSEAFASGFYGDPCCDWDLLERYGEGLMATTSCILGPLPFLVENGTDQQVDEWVERALKIHGDDLYFAIMPHNLDRQRAMNLEIVSIANRHGCPVIYEGDSHYPEAGWVDTQKIAILAGWNKTFEEAEAENLKRIQEGKEVYELWHDGLHIMDELEVRDCFARYHPDLSADIVNEAIRNTDEIAKKIVPYLTDRTIKMPRGARGVDARMTVLGWCREGLKRVDKEGNPFYEEQLNYEAEVIDARNAWPYFMLVGDVVRWARTDEPLPPDAEDPNPVRKRPIRLNTRGSAAASLVCYLSQISTLDPIGHKFKFERFMNPERPSLPDVDIDVASSKRGLLKEYVARKYGRESVADVIAQQHFQPRAALQLVAKTMYGYGSQAFQEIAKLTHEDTGVIDIVHDIDLEKIRERESSLGDWAQRFPVAWEHACRLENAGDPSVLRLSKHAAAIVILPGKVVDYMPTIRASEDDSGTRTAWAETSRVSVVEEIGVVKADFLGLKGMDQQQMVVDAIVENGGEAIDLDALPALIDPHEVESSVMDVFRRGLTLGVNQFSGEGVTAFMKRAEPDNVADLTAINAIYRPGPLGSGGHNRYVKRKNGGEVYEIPEILKPILDDTYGSLVYQEQIMSLFQVLVGYTAGQADDVRKEIDKLNRSKNQTGRMKLAQRHDEFLASATVELGSAEVAEQLWQEILPYTGYAFNRPHAGSYSVQAYQDAYLKSHYPLFFYAVLLTLEEKKTALILREARAFDISTLPPDVNVSGSSFTVDHEAAAIRYGLRGIKGIGGAAADQILEDRPYASLYDFETRSSRKYSKVNKGTREKLLRVGALDCFGARDDWEPIQRAEAELELLGVALEPGGLLGEDGPLIWENIYSEQEVEDLPEDSDVIVGGAVVETRTTTVKKGRQTGAEMAFLRLSLDLDSWSLTCFPDTWASYKSLVEGGEMLLVKGRKDDRGSIIAQAMMTMREYVATKRSELVEA